MGLCLVFIVVGGLYWIINKACNAGGLVGPLVMVVILIILRAMGLR